MPNIDLSILNQRQTPAFYADTLANRPAAGFVGRIFVSTDTFAFYRDNGTSWDLIGGPGTGTVTGTGAAGQVTYWNGASTITGTNNLFYDTVNSRLGVNTNAPTASFDVHSASNTIAQFNQTVATNDTRIAFQNGGSSLWRIGNLYNAGANDFEIFDVVGSLKSLTVKKTTGQVLIGTSTVGTGKLVVVSATSDNGIQIVGATAPSLRIDNAETAPTKRIGLGISTGVNNFIQGSADRDFCIFNGSTAAASPILFGVYDAGAVNVQEAARISAARNFLIGTTTDNGSKLQVSGTSYFNGNLEVGGTGFVSPSGADRFIGVYGGQDCSLILQDAVQLWEVYVNDDFYINRGATTVLQLSRTTGAATFSNTVQAYCPTTTNQSGLIVQASAAGGAGSQPGILFNNSSSVGKYSLYLDVSTNALRISDTASATYFSISNAGNTLIGTTTDAGQKLQVSGEIFASNTISSVASNAGGDGGILFVKNSNIATLNNKAVLAFATDSGGTTTNNPRIQAILTNTIDGSSSLEFYVHSGSGVINKCLTMKSTRVINIASIPTSAVGLVSGDIYSNLGVLTIVP